MGRGEREGRGVENEIIEEERKFLRWKIGRARRGPRDFNARLRDLRNAGATTRRGKERERESVDGWEGREGGERVREREREREGERWASAKKTRVWKLEGKGGIL